jgi:hypothetical protein
MTRAELREPSAGADRSDGGNAEHPSSVDAPRIR